MDKNYIHTVRPAATEQFLKQERILRTPELTYEEKFASVNEAHQLVSSLAAKSHLVLVYGALWVTAGIVLIKVTAPTIGFFSLLFLALPIVGLFQFGLYAFFRVLLHKWKTKVFIMENGEAIHRFEENHGTRSGILRFHKGN